jgi:hypothetical protein
MTEPRMETTKRFPRTLAEAFPGSYPDQFYPLQGFRPRMMHPDVPVALACAFALGFLTGMLVWA